MIGDSVVHSMMLLSHEKDRKVQGKTLNSIKFVEINFLLLVIRTLRPRFTSRYKRSCNALCNKIDAMFINFYAVFSFFFPFSGYGELMEKAFKQL